MTDNVHNVTDLPKEEKKFKFNLKLAVTAVAATIAAVVVVVVVHKLKDDDTSTYEVVEIAEQLAETVSTS